jgi:hypothetical protein
MRIGENPIIKIYQFRIYFFFDQIVKFSCEDILLYVPMIYAISRGRRGCDHMVVGFITTCAISAYHH